MKNIKPDIDLQNSIERSRITESREYYKGKSFNFAKEWHPGINYFNDNYITDFVSYKGTLLVCRRTHLSSNSNRPELLFEDSKDSNQPTGVKSEYWDFILAGTPGPGGKVYIPNYNTSTGELSWVISDNIESINPVNIKGEDGKDGRDGKDGKNGTNGKDGDTYVPQLELDNNYIVFKSLQGKETIKVDCSNLKGEPGEKGEKGNDWIFSKVNTITLSPDDSGYAEISADTPGSESTTYTLTLGIPQGKTGLKGNKGEKGEKGDQGEKGEAGPTPLFKLIRNESTRSIDLYWSIDEDSDWVNLGSVGGKSPKLFRVFDIAEHPNAQNNTRRDDRIVWGYDGVAVSEWTTLCYLDELRGDENIWISTEEVKPGEGNHPVMEVRDPDNPDKTIQVEDRDKIWYDPFDYSLDEFSSFEFVFNAYKEAGGQLSEDAFRNTFANVSNLTIKFWQRTLEDFLKTDASSHQNELWLVRSTTGTSNDTFEEYYAVQSPEVGKWMWEKWGSGSTVVNLSSYYTKIEVDDAISAAKTELKAADTALEGQIVTVTNQLNNKVDKVEGSGLISDTDLNQIRTNKSNIESLQTSVGGKQEALTEGQAVSITEENVIDVKLDPASDAALSKSAEGLKLDLSGVKGSTVKVGVAITGGAEIGADQTIAAGMQALSDSIRTAVAGGITSLTSPDKTITITGTDTSRGLAVNISKLVSSSSAIQIGEDNKLDLYWI